MLRMVGLVEFPKSERLDKNLKTTNAGRLLRQMRYQIAASHRPDRQNTHTVGPVGHSK